ncbi:hypothetical protein [Flavobacterium psychrophilum]|uniref:hypothetical protein n=1 Tax=Flavobacterium psychrophilum TaxID=96345 RepID=UPI001D090AFA|nr:hypothetical protein [Flavobacterium psychrophilum]MCB6098454.1 hypothetical protein [Flavobacterium psychrophilum]
MKTHLVNLLYLQLRQEYQLNKMYEKSGNDTIYKTVVDNFEVVLDIIGFPKDEEYDNISRDYLHQFFTEIEIENIKKVKSSQLSIHHFLFWICKETKKICLENNLQINSYLSSLLIEFETINNN